MFALCYKESHLGNFGVHLHFRLGSDLAWSFGGYTCTYCGGIWMEGWLRYPCQIGWLVLLFRHFSVTGNKQMEKKLLCCFETELWRN